MQATYYISHYAVKYVFFKMRPTQVFFDTLALKSILNFEPKHCQKGKKKKIKTHFLVHEIAKFHPNVLAEKFQKSLF